MKLLSHLHIGRIEVALVAILGAAWVLVWPVGEYLIDDDWAYARSLQHLHETGEVRILDWNPMTLVVHLYWGLLFTKLLGFGFTVSKASTVVLLLTECLAVVALLRHMGVRESTVFMAAMTLVFDPLHFFQSFLYATDIPTLAWTVLSVAFYAMGLSERDGRSIPFLLGGSLFAALAIGVRQTGVILPAAVLLHAALFDRVRLRSARFLAATVALPAVGFGLLTAWYQLSHGPTQAYREATQQVVGVLGATTPWAVVRRSYFVWAYVAFFLLPLLIACPPSAYRLREPRRRMIGLAVCAAFALSFLWITFSEEAVFPFLYNKLTRFGFLSPNELVVGSREVLYPAALAWLLSVVLLAGMCAAALRWLGWGELALEGPRRSILRFLGVVVALQWVYTLATWGIVFDRHLLSLLPTTLVLFAGSLGEVVRPRPAVFTACLAPFAFYALAATHDVHAFSRAAWVLGREVVHSGVDPGLVEAGYAFDGWHMFERTWKEIQQDGCQRTARLDPDGRTADAWYVHELFPRILTKYVVSLSPTMETDEWSHAVAPWARWYATLPRLDNYRVVKERPYISYWPPEKKAVFLLEDATLPPVRRVPCRADP